MVAKQKRPSVAALSLTVRNIPRPVFEQLRERAARHRRSMQGEILAILEAAAGDRSVRRTALETLQRVRSLGLATPAESVEMIRLDRDGR
jgi:plasmid stability protein